jgi:hypothetical protein
VDFVRSAYDLYIDFEGNRLNNVYRVEDPVLITIIEYYFELKSTCVDNKYLKELAKDNMKYYIQKDKVWCIEYLKQEDIELYNVFTGIKN